ncbi:MAG: hypothetical protein Q9157_001237 [Trypethelium eluteriae]
MVAGGGAQDLDHNPIQYYDQLQLFLKPLFPKIASFSRSVQKRYGYLMGTRSSRKLVSQGSTGPRPQYIEMNGKENSKATTKPQTASDSAERIIDQYSLDRTDSRKTAEFV